MNLVINLFNPVKEFCAREEHFTALVDKYPQINFQFAHSREQFQALLTEADGAYVWSFSEGDYKRASKLKFLVTPAAGRDWVAEDPQGRVKVYFSAFHGPMIAESLLAMMLSLNHKLAEQQNLQRAGVWDRNICTGRRLMRGQSVVIYGFGRIGLACARLLGAMGMQITGVNRSGACPGAEDFRVLKSSEAASCLAEADHVVFLLPGSPENEAIINKPFLEKLKVGVRLYNFGRGAVINEADLLELINAGLIESVGLDVTAIEPLPKNHVFYQHPRVLLTPHNSCTYEQYIPLFAEEQEERLAVILKDF